MAAGIANGVDLLHAELERAVALEAQLCALVSQQLRHQEIRHHPPAIDWLRRLEPYAQAHRSSLREALAQLEEEPSRTPHADPGAPGPTVLTRDLREAYALLSATIASHAVVAITAYMLGEQQTAALAEAHVDDANSFLEELAGLILRLTPEAVLESGRE